MSEKIVKPYGSWPSPITPELVSASTISLHEVLVDSARDKIYWLESRPSEQGRFAIVERSSNGSRDVLPAQFSAHASVDELGGGSIALRSNGSILFADVHTQNVYSLDPVSSQAMLVIEAAPGLRYAAFAEHPSNPAWIIAVREDHREATPTTQAYGVHNVLVVIDPNTQQDRVIAAGDDFYAYPQFSPDGTRVCWLQWTHPDMPWTGTVLHVASWRDGQLEHDRQIAGQAKHESIAQPRWAPDGTLFFASDRSGYWQLHALRKDRVSPLHFPGLERAEFAIADWYLESFSYTILDSNTIVAASIVHATSRLVLLNLADMTHRDLQLPFVNLAGAGTGVFRVTHDSICVLGSTASEPEQLALVKGIRSASPTITTLQSTTSHSMPQDLVSYGQHIEVPRSSRPGTTHAIFFAPQSSSHQGPADSLPPCLIYLHGGPNGSTSPALSLSIQYWTTRGFAVAAVNYAGSTGYGREYREELTGHWGDYDVVDTHDAVTHLGAHGLIDRDRVGVYGGSAGGYGTLSVIHRFPTSFRAAVSLYGISDVRALQADSYKFESHDVERLILSACTPGEDEDEQRAKLYRERSPRFHVARITAALLLLQGTDDVAVPREQAYMMVEEMRKHDRTVKFVEFEGEGHGWRKQDTIRRSFEEQEAWWLKHLCDL